MISIHLTPDDLVKMRFAYRPLLDICLSYRILTNPDFQSPYWRWLDEAYPAIYDVDLPYLQATVTPKGYIPDFLTPIPTTNLVDVHDDFETVLATPDSVIQENIQALIEDDGDSEMRRYFLAHPRDAVRCLVSDMEIYWQRTLAHYWPRMISMLEGDVLYRGRLLALDGPGTLFEDLHPSVGYTQNLLRLQPSCPCIHRPLETSLTGDGIQLVPNVFGGCGRMYQIAPHQRFMLAYRIRGAGLWYREQQSSNRSLEQALGAGRARVLQVLVTPANTGELAHKMQISAGAVSQHLKRLTRAGLVEPHRSGKRVFYQLTRRGAELIALFDRTV
jgi:DNA-binding transcriptional ArsR family regulator